MKRYTAIFLAAAILAALLTGCAGTNYGYDGNVSTTDNGYVNGTNDGMGFGSTDLQNDRRSGNGMSGTWDGSVGTGRGTTTPGTNQAGR